MSPELMGLLSIEPHNEQGVPGELLKVSLNFYGMKICGVGTDKLSILSSIARNADRRAIELEVISKWIDREVAEAANATP